MIGDRGSISFPFSGNKVRSKVNLYNSVNFIWSGTDQFQDVVTIERVFSVQDKIVLVK